MKNRDIFYFFIGFFFLISAGQPLRAQSPCDVNGINPFCTDDNPYGITYNSGTSGDASSFFGSSSYACLYSMPAPAYYYLRISSPGDLLIHIRQVSVGGYEIDVDFACWGPFNASNEAAFINNLCTGQYNLDNVTSGSHVPSGGYHNPNDPSTWGGYPNGNLVDCSYSAVGTEWCYIPNAQVGEYYILLLTNYSRSPGTITFSQSSGSANTDCSLLASVSHNGPLCEGETLIFTCDNYQAGATYSWTGPNNWTSNLQNPVIQNTTAAMSGTYTFQMIHQGETFTESTSVQIYPLPVVNITPPNPAVCDGDTISLQASGGGTYEWSNGSTDSIITVVPTQTETYSVTVTSDFGCVSSSSTTIRYGQTNNYSLLDEICSGNRVSVSPYDPSVRYVWNSGETSYSILPQVSVPTQYVVVITDSNGCVVTDSIMVYPTPVADFIADAYSKEMEDGMAVINFTDLSEGAEIWKWSFGDQGASGNFSDVPSPLYVYTRPGLYNICQVVSTAHNCADTLCRRVLITTPFNFYIPNSFTPYRQNGLNDIFAPKGVGIMPENYEMVIYNQYGQLIFKTNELFGGWDGSLPNGEIAPLGVYVYRITLYDFSEDEKIYYGTVTLIR